MVFKLNFLRIDTFEIVYNIVRVYYWERIVKIFWGNFVLIEVSKIKTKHSELVKTVKDFVIMIFNRHFAIVVDCICISRCWCGFVYAPPMIVVLK